MVNPNTNCVLISHNQSSTNAVFDKLKQQFYSLPDWLRPKLIGAAYKYIEQRIGQIKDKIASIPEPDEEYSCFSLMYTRGDDTPARTPSTGGGGGSCDCEDTTSISNSEIDKWF